MGKMKDLLIELQETVIVKTCPTCDGVGMVEFDIPRPHNFGRDVGVIDVGHEHCDTCDGDGEIDQLCEHCGEPVTMIMGKDATICEECA